MNLAKHLGLDYAAGTGGGEYAGECPWCGGTDRFRVWPDQGETSQFWCRQCGRSGDAIDYLREHRDMSFVEACERAGAGWKIDDDFDEGSTQGASTQPQRTEYSKPDERDKCTPPPKRWRRLTEAFAEMTKDRLWQDSNTAGSARRYLIEERGFGEEVLRGAKVGLNTEDRYYPAEDWGLDSDSKIWIPRGIVIPWQMDATMWGVNVRRPDGDVDESSSGYDSRKYQRVTGSTNSLYAYDRLDGRPAVLVEGELDALAIRQSADNVVAVATGSTHWGRKPKWKSHLRRNAEFVLVSFDNDAEGASRYWLDEIAASVRHRPSGHDTAEMLQHGKDVGVWVEAGLSKAKETLKSATM